jgi:hypothetical protein
MLVNAPLVTQIIHSLQNHVGSVSSIGHFAYLEVVIDDLQLFVDGRYRPCCQALVAARISRGPRVRRNRYMVRQAVKLCLETLASAFVDGRDVERGEPVAGGGFKPWGEEQIFN